MCHVAPLVDRWADFKLTHYRTEGHRYREKRGVLRDRREAVAAGSLAAGDGRVSLADAFVRELA